MSGKDIRETVGLLLVVASMVFVGLEIRQNAAATRASTVLQLKDGWSQLNLTYIENPETAVAWEAVLAQGFENSDVQTQLIVASIMRTLFHNWSNAYYQYRAGTLNDEQWLPLVRDIEWESDKPYTWTVWDQWNHIYDEPFRDLMDSVRTANFSASP